MIAALWKTETVIAKKACVPYDARPLGRSAMVESHLQIIWIDLALAPNKMKRF